jgi:hypothetical protein
MASSTRLLSDSGNSSIPVYSRKEILISLFFISDMGDQKCDKSNNILPPTVAVAPGKDIFIFLSKLY